MASSTPTKDRVSNTTRKLEKLTNQGFTEFDSLEELNDFYSKDPEEVDSSLEPPLFKSKPTNRDLRNSGGHY